MIKNFVFSKSIKLNNMMDRRLFRGTSKFLVYKSVFGSAVEDIETFIKESSINLTSKESELNRAFEEAMSLQDEDDGPDVEGIFIDELYKHEKVFILHTYNPLLLTVYSILEFWLKKCCELDSRRGFSLIKVSDLAGNNYIEKSRRYLELVAHLDLTEGEQSWLKLLDVQRIRNCIAHHNANIFRDPNKPLKDHDLYSLLKGNPHISLDDTIGDFYIRDKDFLLDTLKHIKKYVFLVIEKLSVRKVVARNTTMPYNNAEWGEEKADSALKGIIHSMGLIDGFRSRTDEFREIDFLSNLEGGLTQISNDVTKLYAFFADGKWDPGDGKLITDKRMEGLKHLRSAYNSSRGNQDFQ